jgi:hypothetical protein
MTTDKPHLSGSRDPRFALGQSIGLAAFVWGYPLVETFRTCRLQVLATAGERVAWKASIDQLHHVQRPSTAEDRDVVTPANDLLYSTGWINLANGPRYLHVPSSIKHQGRYFVLALYDNWTNNFENPGLRTSPPAGETVLLLGPDTRSDFVAPPGCRVVRSPSNLVWMIGRIVVGTGEDVAKAQALQADIRLEAAAGTDRGELPDAVSHWVGAPQDSVAALQERPQDALAIAGAFFTNLCQCLGESHPPASDEGIADWFTRGKLVPGKAFSWDWRDAPLRAGLQQGLEDGVALLVSASRSHSARPWAAHFGLGVYGTGYLTRALTAYKGLGALASNEAVYAMGDFDGHKQALTGQHRYLMRFEAGDLPPVDAFWSITLYDADRFLYANPLARYSIGDRTPHLQRDPDGGLTLQISHSAPQETSNWLPAPTESFYLILRMYCPRDEARTWRIPALERVATEIQA